MAPPSGRTAGGFRLYTDADIDRLRLVKQMKPLDFSLEEMGALLDVRDRLARDASDGEREQLIERIGIAATLHREAARAGRPSPPKR